MIEEARQPDSPIERENPSPSLTFIELFAGIGLVRLGLSSSGWKCVFANDIDPDKAEIYRKNFGEKEFVLSDIRNLRGADIPDADLLVATFPCQDLSLAGKRAGLEGDRSSLVNEALRILKEKNQAGDKPIKLVLLENVEGFLYSNKGKDILSILEELNTLGYGIDVLLIDAAYFVPQSRRRVFILGRLGQSINPSPADPFSHPFRPKKIKELAEKASNIVWSFLDLPEIPLSRGILLDDLIENNVDNQLWFPEEKTERELARVKGRSMERLWEAIREAQRTGKPVRLTGYRRVRKGETLLELRSDGLAGCLRVPTGGSSRQLLVEARPDGSVGVRYMTPKEYAGLQGVFVPFWVPENEKKALKGFGDAVAVPVLEWLGGVLAREASLLSRQLEYVFEEIVASTE